MPQAPETGLAYDVWHIANPGAKFLSPQGTLGVRNPFWQMMRPKILSLFVATLICLIACSDRSASENARLQAEVLSLTKQLSTVTQERDDLKFGASRVLAEAEESVAKSDWVNVKLQSETLLAKHPSAPEAVRARALLNRAQSSLAQAARDAAAAESKKAETERLQKIQNEKKLAASLYKMAKSVDSLENVTWYRDQTSPRYSNYNGFFLYVGKKDGGNPWLRFRVQYSAADWLFIESFLVVADGQRFEYAATKFDRDHNSEIWEWYDENASEADLEMIKSVVAAKTAVIRFNGKQYRRDRTITQAEKAALQNVLDAYKALGGS